MGLPGPHRHVDFSQGRADGAIEQAEVLTERDHQIRDVGVVVGPVDVEWAVAGQDDRVTTDRMAEGLEFGGDAVGDGVDVCGLDNGCC